MNLTLRVVISVATPTVLFLWEHIARQRKSNIRPSVGLTKVANFASNWFYKLGRLLARISSFYTLIELKELQQTAHDLLEPAVRLIASPAQTLFGYCNYAFMRRYPMVILWGSVTLLGLIVAGYRYYPQMIMFLKVK